jgi:TonB family protein
MKFVRLFLRSLAFSFLFAFLISASDVSWLRQEPKEPAAIDPARANAEKLFQEKRYRDAANAFKSLSKKQPENADIWLRLGLSYFYSQKIKDAVKAFETAIRLRPNDETAHTNLGFVYIVTNNLKQAEQEAITALKINQKNFYAFEIMGRVKLRQDNPSEALRNIEQAVQLNPNRADLHLLKAQTYIRSYAKFRVGITESSSEWPEEKREGATTRRKEAFKQAAESLTAYLSLKPSPETQAMWQQQLEALQAYSGKIDLSGVSGQVVDMKGPSLRPTITYKEKARYTDTARNNGVQGTVTIMVIFAADGTLRHPIILHSLDEGLDQNALIATSKIKFIPAAKDGKAVSVIGNLEFSFNLY